MTKHIQDWVAEMVKTHGLQGKDVLEVGSYNVNGSVRDLFSARTYLGVDMASGPGVDLVCNAHHLTDNIGMTFDIVVCCETLEHDNDFQATLREMKELTKEYLIITTPANGFPDHKYPKDYWRFMQDAYREVLFSGFAILNLTEVGDEGFRTTCCLGKKI